MRVKLIAGDSNRVYKNGIGRGVAVRKTDDVLDGEAIVQMLSEKLPGFSVSIKKKRHANNIVFLLDGPEAYIVGVRLYPTDRLGHMRITVHKTDDIDNFDFNAIYTWSSDTLIAERKVYSMDPEKAVEIIVDIIN
jgi:hypothetical protein